VINLDRLDRANGAVMRVARDAQLHLIANLGRYIESLLQAILQRLSSCAITSLPILLSGGVGRVVAQPVAVQRM
jgi:hypothetical protein